MWYTLGKDNALSLEEGKCTKDNALRYEERMGEGKGEGIDEGAAVVVAVDKETCASAGDLATFPTRA